MSQALTPGSLQDIAQQQNKSIAQTFMSVDAIVCVDTSLSMMNKDTQDGRSRYDHACEQLIRLQRQLPGKVGVISWSSRKTFNPGGIPDSPYGSTDLVGLLQFIKPADGCGIKLIVISDGEPDYPQGALDVARTFKTPIETIYIGPEGGPGRDFLRRLAEATGGQAVSQSVRDIQNLSQTVKGLLAA
jgi:hypothetical protein